SFSSALFFFSSRRRHTRCYRDWSSDVCSSDLYGSAAPGAEEPYFRSGARWNESMVPQAAKPAAPGAEEPYFRSSERRPLHVPVRSEERRVGKECRAWGSPASDKGRTKLQHGDR